MRVLPSITLIAAGTATAVLSTACGGDPPYSPPPDPPPMATIVQGYVRSLADSTPVSGLRVTACEYTFPPLIAPEIPQPAYKELAWTDSRPDGSYNLSFTASCRSGSSIFLTVAALPRSPSRVRATTSNGQPINVNTPWFCDLPNIQADLWVEPNATRGCP